MATHSGTATTPLQYAGQYTDAESGLVYMRARYYDPATAQFLTVDPLVNITLTPYSYVDDSPLDSSDPSGLCPSSHGKQNRKSKEFEGWTEEELQQAYDDPSTPPAMRQKIKKQQKASKRVHLGRVVSRRSRSRTPETRATSTGTT